LINLIVGSSRVSVFRVGSFFWSFYLSTHSSPRAQLACIHRCWDLSRRSIRADFQLDQWLQRSATPKSAFSETLQNFRSSTQNFRDPTGTLQTLQFNPESFEKPIYPTSTSKLPISDFVSIHTCISPTISRHMPRPGSKVVWEVEGGQGSCWSHSSQI
jgi:hypothetical protein